MRPEDALKQDSVLLQLIVPRRPPSLFSDIPSLMQSLDRIYRKRMRAFERRSGRRRSSRRRNGHHHRLYHIVSPETTYAPSSESRVRFPGESDDWLERPRWNRRKPVRWPGMRHFDWNGGGRNLGAWNRMRIALGQPSLDTDHDFDRLSSEAQRHTHEPAQTAAHSYSSDHPYEPQPLFWGWGSNSASTTSKPPVASPNQSKTIRFLLHRLFESVSPNTVLYYINRVFSDQRKNEAFVKKLVELSRDAAPTRPAVEFLASLEQPDSGHQPASQTHLELENADRENSNLSGKTSQTMMASGRKPHLNLRYYMTNLNLYNWNGAQRHRRASRWANAPIVAQNTVIDYTRIFFELIPVILALRQLFMDPDNFRLPPDTFLRQPFDRYGRPVGYPPNSPECYYNPRLCGPEIIRNEDEFLPDETEDPMQKLYAHSLSSIFKKSSSTPPQPTVQIVKATQPPSTNSPMIAVTTPAPSPPAASQQPALVSQVQPEQPELQPPQSNAQVEVASSSVASSAATSDMYAPQSEIQPTNGYAYTNSAGSELPVYAPTYGQNPYNGIAYTYVPASGYVASAESAADNNADNSNNSNNVSGYPTNPSSSSAQSRFKRSNRFSGRFGESRLKFHRMSLLATRKGFNSKLKFKSDSTRCRCKMRSSRNPHCRCVHRSFGPHRKSIHD